MNPRARAKAQAKSKRPGGEWRRGKTKGRRLLELFWATGGRCHYCGRGCILKPASECDPLRATADHLLPVARGGTNAWANLRLACFECNAAKADKLPERKEDLLAIRDTYGMACIKEELRLLGGLEPRYERSRGTWYPASRDTGDPAWVPGERSATYKTKYDCESAIAAHDAREERQRNGTQGKASAAGAEEE